jgi:hypothetical protein
MHENLEGESLNTCAVLLDVDEQRCPSAQTLFDLREPIFGLTTAARVCQRWLNMDQPNLDELRMLMAQITETSEAATAILNGRS